MKMLLKASRSELARKSTKRAGNQANSDGAPTADSLQTITVIVIDYQYVHLNANRWCIVKYVRVC